MRRVGHRPRPGDPWQFEPRMAESGFPQRLTLSADFWPTGRFPAQGVTSPDTTSVNTVDAQGNLFSAAPSSAWVFGGTFIAGDTGVRLDNGKPFLAISTPGGDSQDQQILQVLLNIAVFDMPPQEAVEAPRFNSMHLRQSFGDHRFLPGVLLLEDRLPNRTVLALQERGHRVKVVGSFMMLTANTLVGVDPGYGTLFGAADVRGQRFVIGW